MFRNTNETSCLVFITKFNSLILKRMNVVEKSE